MNRIILIGNGFDLAHGLKTRYKDFIDWFWKQQASEVQNSEEWQESKDFSNKFITAKYDKNLDFSKFKDNCTYTNKFLERMIKEYAKNWCDIEAIYFQRLKECRKNFDKTKDDYKQEVENLNFDFDQIEDKLKEYLKNETKEKKLIDIDDKGNHILKVDFESELQKKIE